MSDGSRNSIRAFSALEEEFFRAGELRSEAEPAESFEDLEEPPRPRSIFRRLFSRKTTES